MAEALGRLLMLLDAGVLHPPTPEAMKVARMVLESIEAAVDHLPKPGKPGDSELAAFYRGRAEGRGLLISAGLQDDSTPTQKWTQRAEWALPKTTRRL